MLTFDAEVLAGTIEARLGRALRHGDTIAVTLTGLLQPGSGRTPIVGEDLIEIHAPGKRR